MEVLTKYKDSLIEWQRQKNLYESLKTLTEASGMDYSKTKVQTSPTDTMANAVVRMIEQEAKVKEAFNECMNAYVDAQNAIINLEDVEGRIVLTCRYIDLLRPDGTIRPLEWEEIADKLGWSIAKVYKVRNRAIGLLRKKYSQI